MSGIYKSADGARAVAARYREFLNRWPVPNTQSLVATREGETFVIACGPERAAPVLLLHGAASNSAMWMDDVALWASRFRIYAVDMIGEAGLSAPARPALDGDAHALWLDDVLQGLALTRVAMVGVSLGGWLALDYATRRPGRVDGLALLCPAGIGRQKNFMLKAAPFLLLGAWGRRRVRDMVFGPAPALVSSDAQQLGALLALIHANFRPRLTKIPLFRDEALRGLTTALMCVVGGRDVFIDSADTKRRLALNVPDAEVDYVPEAGHILRGQAAAVLTFLSRAAGSAGTDQKTPDQNTPDQSRFDQNQKGLTNSA